MRSTIIEIGQVLSERECLGAIAPRQCLSSKSAYFGHSQAQIVILRVWQHQERIPFFSFHLIRLFIIVSNQASLWAQWWQKENSGVLSESWGEESLQEFVELDSWKLSLVLS